MPRLQLEPRSRYSHTCELTVRTTDLNYGGHLGNDRVLALVHEARVSWLAAQGWTELDCAGASLIMADAAIRFLAEAFAGDRLRCETACGEAERVGFRLFHHLSRPADGASIALVETGLVCFDYAARRPLGLPAPLRALCAD